MPKGLLPLLCALTLGSISLGSGVLGHRVAVGPSVAHAADAEVAPLPFFYDLYTFRGDDGGTAVVAAVAVPVRRLRREREANQVRYRFDVRFVLADTARREVVTTLDSVYVSRRYALPRRHLLHTHIEIEADPSAATVQRVVVTDAARPGVGQLYRSPFPIPDYSGDELMLSDLAFGLPGAEAGWSRGDVTLALLPTSQFPESAFDIYYEVYNLSAGTPYETEIAIEPIGDDRDEESGVVRAFFSGESTSDAEGALGELRRVESALPEGRYRLTVTVTDQLRGRTASRSRDVQVRGWRDGTTLVRALPRGER